MIIVCPNCSTRLQVDQERSPNRPFNVRCPKCNATVNAGGTSPALDQSALAVGGSPSTDHPRFEPATASAYESADKPSPALEAASANEAIQMLAQLLAKSGREPENPGARPAWNKRKALVCASETYREPVARRLSDNG